MSPSSLPPQWETSEPDCDGRGSGCYECSYHNSGDNGYTICSEFPDGTGPFNGKPLCDPVAAIPDDWPPPDPNIFDPDPGEAPPGVPPPDTGGYDGGGFGGGDGGCETSPSHDCSDGIVIREMSELVPLASLLPRPITESQQVRAPWQ